MTQSVDAISVRTARLNNVLLGGRGYGVSSTMSESINRESLLDALCLLYNECDKEALRKRDKNIAEFVNKYRSIVDETRQLRVNVKDFNVRSLIGQGYFGNVHLVVEKQTGDIYAMKKIKKSMVTTSQLKEERDIMSKRSSDWITNLQYAFQDNENLFLIMEYLPGGDLLSLMSRHGPFDEDLTRFYLAELTLAINALHVMGYVHRDIKPENILIDRFGHIKLGDFGNAAALDRDGHVFSLSPVGTPDYIAPELLQTISAHKLTKNKHDVSCDFWSMGIIGYELICEVTPFNEDNVHETYAKILSHCEESHLKELISFPSELKLSDSYKRLIESLVTKPSRRLNYDAIKKHSYFDNVNWDLLRSQVPPIIPTVRADDDTSNFADMQRKKTKAAACANTKKISTSRVKSNDFCGKDLPFIGYTFVHMEELLKPESEQGSTSEEAHRLEKMNKQLKEEQAKNRECLENIAKLKQELLRAELKTRQTNTQSLVLDGAKEEISKMKAVIKEKNNELVNWRTQMKTLQSSLKIEQEMWEKKEATITELLRMNRQKYEEAKIAAESRFEKRIHEKKIEIENINSKLDEREAELNTKSEECSHLQQKLENYQELLKRHKEQAQKDRDEFEKNKSHLSDIYEQKLMELRSKLRHEKNDKSRLTLDVRDLRTELDDTLVSKRSSEEAKLATAKTSDEILKRLNKEIEANKELHKQNLELHHKHSESIKTIELLQQDVARLEREIQVSECSKDLTDQIGIVEQTSRYETAPGSLSDIRVIEEQLRTDLEVAKENEISQKARADKLQDIVEKLEEMLERFNEQSLSPSKPMPAPRTGNTNASVGDMLEKQNERLEDKLSAVREQMIVERQSARSANLSLWKAEKQMEEVMSEKKMLQRRMELTEERIKKVQGEHEETKRLCKAAEEKTKHKEERIEEMKHELLLLKNDVRKEQTKWEKSERERMESKSEIIKHISQSQALEARLSETREKLQQSQQKCEKMDLENKRLMRDLNDEKEALSNTQDKMTALQIELQTLKDNYERLKYACTITDNQLTEVEAMLQKEQLCNKSSQEKLDKLYAQMRLKEESESALKKQLMHVQTLHQNSEANISSLSKQVKEQQNTIEDMNNKYSNQQQHLIEQTTLLFDTQEKVEVQQNENQSLQVLSENQERELFLLKEENARILSDLFYAKEEAHSLQRTLNESLSLNADLQKEIQDAKILLEEKSNFYLQRDIKSEATLSQHKKLIDYLQLKVEDLSQKKKKTLADKIFGHNSTATSSKKENPSSQHTENSIITRTLKEELKREKLQCKTLREQLERLQEKQQTNITTRSPLKSKENQLNVKIDTKSDNDKGQQLENTIKPTSPTSSKPGDGVSAKLVQSHHRFELALQEVNRDASHCVACKNPIIAGAPYWKCRECKDQVHRKCRSDVKSACGGIAAILSAVASEPVAKALETVSLEPSAPLKNELDSDSISKFSYEARLEEPDTLGEKPGSIRGGEQSLVYTVHSESDKAPLEVTCAYEMEENKIILLGCNSGLYALHIASSELVHIAGIDAVNCIAVSHPLAKAIMVGSQGETLYQCDFRQLQSRCQSSGGCLNSALEASVLELPFANRASTEKWQLIQISQETDQPLDTIAIAATSCRIVILKYDVKQQKFKPVTALDTATPVTSISFTRHTAIVASDKFFEIDLSTYGAEEFTDVSDQTLTHTQNYTPVVALRISKSEFLLCFMESGVFVDEYGCRSRPYDIHWEYTPCGFLYRAPFLFVTHFQTLQILRIHRSFSDEVKNSSEQKDEKAEGGNLPNFKRCYMPFYMPSILTESGKLNAFILAIQKSTGLQEIHHIDALQAFRQKHNESLETISSVATSITLGSLATTIDE